MQHADVETLFSLARNLPEPEPFDGDVDATLLERASLARGSVRQLCSLRTLAEGGALLHADMPIDIGERVTLDLPSGHRIEGIVSWSEGFNVSVRFDRPLDLLGIIARNLVNQPGDRRRLPRIELDCGIRLASCGVSDHGRVRDISQGGVRVETALTLAAGDKIELLIEDLGSMTGEVCWAEGRIAGISFADELGWQALMPWLRQIRDKALTLAPEVGQAETKPIRASDPPSGRAVRLNIAARVREGTRRWNIDVRSIDSRHVEFECFGALRIGTLLWVVLPGLEGWSARIVGIEGHLYTGEFTHPLHPAVLKRILASPQGPPATAALN